MIFRRALNIVLPGLLLCTLAGCQSAYYAAWQKLGYEKRDILVSRVQKTAEAQTAAKQQFQTTLDQFKGITHFNGGDLEAEYKKLNADYEDCKSRADSVVNEIASVDKVATAMFDEWNSELSEYSDPKLKESSQQKLNDSKARYKQLLTLMLKSADTMTPVLTKFHDNVLYLKHNLNASAIASLQGTSVEIDTNVQNLVQQMDASITEAQSFIENLKKT
jgi:hypothetical protein